MSTVPEAAGRRLPFGLSGGTFELQEYALVGVVIVLLIVGAILEPVTPLGTPFGETSGPERTGAQLDGLLVRWSIDPLLAIELYGLLRIARGGTPYDGSQFSIPRFSSDLFTGALRVSGDKKGFTYGVEGAYQFGRASPSLGQSDISSASGLEPGSLERALVAPVSSENDGALLRNG